MHTHQVSCSTQEDTLNAEIFFSTILNAQESILLWTFPHEPNKSNEITIYTILYDVNYLTICIISFQLVRYSLSWGSICAAEKEMQELTAEGNESTDMEEKM